jgi:hypothetical protein
MDCVYESGLKHISTFGLDIPQVAAWVNGDSNGKPPLLAVNARGESRAGIQHDGAGRAIETSIVGKLTMYSLVYRVVIGRDGRWCERLENAIDEDMYTSRVQGPGSRLSRHEGTELTAPFPVTVNFIDRQAGC